MLKTGTEDASSAGSYPDGFDPNDFYAPDDGPRQETAEEEQERLLREFGMDPPRMHVGPERPAGPSATELLGRLAFRDDEAERPTPELDYGRFELAAQAAPAVDYAASSARVKAEEQAACEAEDAAQEATDRRRREYYARLEREVRPKTEGSSGKSGVR